MMFQSKKPTIRLLWVEESFIFSANAGAHAEYAYYQRCQWNIAGQELLGCPHLSRMLKI